jgi:hypothetical protein
MRRSGSPHARAQGSWGALPRLGSRGRWPVQPVDTRRGFWPSSPKRRARGQAWLSVRSRRRHPRWDTYPLRRKKDDLIGVARDEEFVRKRWTIRNQPHSPKRPAQDPGAPGTASRAAHVEHRLAVRVGDLDLQMSARRSRQTPRRGEALGRAPTREAAVPSWNGGSAIGVEGPGDPARGGRPGTRCPQQLTSHMLPGAGVPDHRAAVS